MNQTKAERAAVQKALYWSDPVKQRERDRERYAARVLLKAQQEAYPIIHDGSAVQNVLTMWGR